MPQTATIKSLPEAFACLSRHAVSSFPDSNDMALKHGISDSLLDDRRILQGPQVRHGRPGGCRRSQALSRLRRHHRLQSAPAHGAGSAGCSGRRSRGRNRRARSRRPRNGQEQGAARKPRRSNLRGRRSAARQLPLHASRCPGPSSSGKVTATPTLASTGHYGTTICSRRTRQWEGPAPILTAGSAAREQIG